MHLRMFELARDHLQNGVSPPVEVIGGLISPVSDAYGKAGLVSARHRCAMLNLALLTNDWIEHLVSQFGLVVVTRSGCDAARFIYETDCLYRNRHNIHLVTEWMTNDISSTGIRRALARGESVKYLLQDSVITYIQEHGLYRPSSVENQDDSDNGQETAV
ncbi:nicotinamide mononucleotide adenylyltransferase, putative [Ixodes scapularis]|uniref:Nicotinamide mononucleotide adenylyltransferase, putative n=1 Tax=Ixodes scapularis TaxID=6945 RepID=B7PTY5_IXOSC|nr:nicotinamide mononucleotide adenylyltransferase, putative [Ixodes scapularis]|eukprot:XP_002405065.1 nicotinamide mononucleotide adenylyltransferase, putative [Ixodes scapularis]